MLDVSTLDNTWLTTYFYSSSVRKQIQHMIKYRYVPFTMGKKNYRKDNS